MDNPPYVPVRCSYCGQPASIKEFYVMHQMHKECFDEMLAKVRIEPAATKDMK